MSGDTGTCRSCGAPIRWVRMESRRAKRMPIDAEKVDGGNVEVIERLHGADVARVVEAERGVKRYVSHFATCPQASLWRGGEA